MRHRILIAWPVFLLLPLAASAEAGQTARPYVPKATWIETMIASRQAALAVSASTGPETRRPLPDLGKSDFTAMAWIWSRSGGTIIAVAPSGGKWVPQGKALFVRDGKACFDVGWVGVVTSDKSVANREWHHVALVAKGGSQEIFIDGQSAGRGNLAREPDNPNWVFKIGSAASNFGGDFEGSLDDVRLYNRALTAKEIAAQVAKPGPADEPGLVGYWPMDGDGRDASGSQNDATLPKVCDFIDGHVGKAIYLSGGGATVARGRSGDPAAWLWTRLRQDFPDALSRREMDWERADGIWDGAKADDWPSLARRYLLAADIKSDAARANLVKDLPRLLAIRAEYLQTRARRAIQEQLAPFDLPGLRIMIASLIEKHGEAYPKGVQYLARLAELEKQASALADKPEDMETWARNMDALRREALVADHPLLRGTKIVFIKRKTFQSNHYYTDYINGSHFFGGALCIMDLSTGKVTDLVPSMSEGIFDRFDVSFDAKRIVFDWKKCPDEGFRIFEVGVDGTGLRQLTFSPPNEQELEKKYRLTNEYPHATDDMHPCYLADGGICFISSRCQYGILCDPPDNFTTTVLYRMDGDGKNMEKLTNSSVSEASPVALPDGRILYTRWEYVDKGAVSVKCLWAMRPDGTNSVEIYGNDIALPPTLIHGRPIPGNPSQYVVLGTPHCPQNRVGTVIRLDMTQNIRTRDPMTYLTPFLDIRAEGGFHHRGSEAEPWIRTGKGPLFADPYPLSAQWYLVSYNPDKDFHDATAYQLHLLHESGRVVPLYSDPAISCWEPFVLAPRPVPPVLTSSRDAKLAARNEAVAVVTDVYHNLEGVPRGTIKYLRVLEQVPRPWSARRWWGGDVYDQQHPVISKDTHLGLKVQHGVVPVEEDGSAQFVVPADKNIFLQVLDENYRAVQTERTYVNYRPGEVRTCIGCHETNLNATPASREPHVLALKRPPSVPGPQPGETTGRRPLYYPADVQPVLDARCVRCHNGDPKAPPDLRGTETALFSVSYENLLNHKYMPFIGENHPKTGNVEYLPPKSLGSHNSKLVDLLRKGHYDVKLSLPEMIRITNWVDTNGQFYGSYFGRRNIRYRNLPDYRPTPTWESAIGIPPAGTK